MFGGGGGGGGGGRRITTERGGGGVWGKSIATGLGREPVGGCYSAEMRRPAIRSTAHDPILSYPTYQPPIQDVSLQISVPNCVPLRGGGGGGGGGGGDDALQPKGGGGVWGKSIATGLGREPVGGCYSAEMRRPAIRSTAHDPILSYPTYQPPIQDVSLQISVPNCVPLRGYTNTRSLSAPEPMLDLFSVCSTDINLKAISWR